MESCIAVLMPSRGIVSSRCPESILRELRGVNHEFFFEHTLPIPDSFNSIVDKALLSPSWTHAWFVEEDIVVPEQGLSKLLAFGTDLTAIDYRLKIGGGPSYLEADGRICWMSLGCTLVRRKVFAELSRPYFRSDKRLTARHEGSASKNWTFRFIDRKDGEGIDYGNQDVYFSGRALIEGYTLGAVEGMICEHLNLPYETVSRDRSRE